MMRDMTVCYYFNKKVEQLSHLDRLKKQFSNDDIEFILYEIKDFTEDHLKPLREKKIKAVPCLEIIVDGESSLLYGEQLYEEYEMQIKERL